MFEIERSVVGDESSTPISPDFFKAKIKQIVEHPEYLVGKGSVSEVYALIENSQICLKITDPNETYGTINYELRGERPFFNSPHIEGGFLAELERLDSDVRVPRAYYYGTVSVEHPNAESSEVSVLAMEYLDAVSFENVFALKEDLPASFNLEPFFEKLEKFFEKMHDKNIYHRDVHEGNIMIDRKTGAPYVIDFGTAAHGNEEDVYIGSRRGALTKFKKDDSGLRALRRKTQQFLTGVTN